MLKKIVLSILLGVSFLGSIAQAPAEPAGEKDSLIYKTILIVPFNPKLYLSDIDKDILAGSNIGFKELVNLYRSELTTKLRAKLSKQYSVTYMQSRKDKDTIDDLNFTYSSIGYNYEPVPEIKGKAKQNISGIFKKKEARKAPEQADNDGQLHDNTDRRPKYMATVITNKNYLPYLQKKYNADYIIFINQFETKTDVSDYSALGRDQNKRIIKVHYTCLDKSGERVCSNIAEETFESEMNNANEIIKSKFPLLAGKISDCIPEGIILKRKSTKNN